MRMMPFGSLLRPGIHPFKTLSSFHPRFTYPIFGEEERIFGYQGLRINLRFAAHDLYPNLEISYDSKFVPVGDTKATDIVEILKESLPPCELYMYSNGFQKNFTESLHPQMRSIRLQVSKQSFRMAHLRQHSNRPGSSQRLIPAKAAITKYGAVS